MIEVEVRHYAPQCPSCAACVNDAVGVQCPRCRGTLGAAVSIDATIVLDDAAGEGLENRPEVVSVHGSAE